MAYRQQVKKPSLFSRLTRSVGQSDVVVPSAVVAFFVYSLSSFWWGFVAGLGMILAEIANLKDEIRKK